MCVAVLINVYTLNILHDEVRQTLRSSTAVNESRDIGMVEICQDLTFGAEAIHKLFRNKDAINDFDGDVLAVFIVDAGPTVNRPHASGADLIQHFVRPQNPT